MLVGCYAPSAPNGAPCADGQLCPAGLTCTATPAGDRCLDEPPGGIDAPEDPPIDGPPGGCTPRVLLAAGTEPEAQGWVLEHAGTGFSHSVTPGFLELKTTSDTRQMLVLANAVPTDRFVVELVVQVDASGGHTDTDAAVALMASFHTPVGSSTDLTRMIKLDTDSMSFDGASIGLTTTVMQTYRIERTAAGGIKVSIPNGGSISTSPFTTNGTIAIGDQTQAAGLDSTLRIASVTLMCP